MHLKGYKPGLRKRQKRIAAISQSELVLKFDKQARPSDAQNTAATHGGSTMGSRNANSIAHSGTPPEAETEETVVSSTLNWDEIKGRSQKANAYTNKLPSKDGPKISSAVTSHPLKTLDKYAFGKIKNYPNQDGGDIDRKILKERVALMATALVTQTNTDVTYPPPRLPKYLDEAKGRPEFLSYAKAHEEELERHESNGLHAYSFVNALPSDILILYAISYKARTNQYGGLKR